MEISEETRLKVKFGAKLLDLSVCVPVNWRSKINRQTLDLSDYHYCVLGQTFGTFGDGASDLEAEHDQEDDPGFLVANGFLAEEHGKETARAEYEELTAAWREYLTP